MSSRVHGVADFGADGTVIDIECHITSGLPSVVIVGFANKAVDEAKERLRGAFTNSDLELPRKRITINLAPADLPKDSTSFDLPIAVSILAAAKLVNLGEPRSKMFIGELGLDGSIRAIRGIIGKLLAARKLGYKHFYVPAGNLKQARLIPGIILFPVLSLRDLYLHLTETVKINPVVTDNEKFIVTKNTTQGSDFRHIVGQDRAKRALEIAAAGSHNVLLNGPPGTGKSMLAKALASILSPLTHEEVLEITQLNSLASKTYDKTVSERPFQSPHHSSSDIAIIGGGQSPRPGQISLAHRGILFLDEFPEFSRMAIEALRQPLEDKIITVSRAKDSLTFPANFILIATANPCPCGYYGTKKACNCTPHQISRYQRKLSGPIIDRIDMYVDVDEVVHRNLLATGDQEASEKIAARVARARNIQSKRYKNQQKTNSDMSNQDIKSTSLLSDKAKDILDQASESLRISARHYMRSIKVARTIADLEGSETIEPEHITEALQYRKKEDYL